MRLTNAVLQQAVLRPNAAWPQPSGEWRIAGFNRARREDVQLFPPWQGSLVKLERLRTK